MSKFDFEGFDKQVEASLERNKRVIQDTFMNDEGAMWALLQQSVAEGWRTPDEAEAEMADFRVAQDVGRTAVQTSPHFYQ